MALTIENLTAAIRAVANERPSEPNFLKEINNFKRKPPSYDVGVISFAQFRLDFDLAAEQSGFRVPVDGEAADITLSRDKCLKGLLYQCLTGTARAMAGQRMYPGSSECESLTFDEYSQGLESLFDSRTESDAAKIEFKHRRQRKFESPMLYVTDKVQLYERAYPLEQRDTTTLCDELTSGLLNKQIQASLREFEAASREDYEKRLRFLANAQHKKLLNKEISHAEGIALHSVSMSYLNQSQRRNDSHVKSEPGINALNMSGGRCFWCSEKGHFVNKCPRKMAGMAQSVNAIEAESDSTVEIPDLETDPTDEMVAAIAGKPTQPVPKDKQTRRPRKWRRFRAKRDANGVHYFCTFSDDDETPVSAEMENEEGATSGDPYTEEESVNTLESHEFDFDNWTDDFLGM